MKLKKLLKLMERAYFVIRDSEYNILCSNVPRYTSINFCKEATEQVLKMYENCYVEAVKADDNGQIQTGPFVVITINSIKPNKKPKNLLSDTDVKEILDFTDETKLKDVLEKLKLNNIDAQIFFEDHPGQYPAKAFYDHFLYVYFDATKRDAILCQQWAYQFEMDFERGLGNDLLKEHSECNISKMVYDDDPRLPISNGPVIVIHVKKCKEET